MENNYIAIIAGGIGSRYWPESRLRMPKQFLDVLGTGKTLLQQTYARYEHLAKKENIFIVTNRLYVDIVKQQLPDFPAENILAEPYRKSTAPTAAFLTTKILSINPNANILMTPSDHLITDERTFERNVFEAFSFLKRNNAFVTFGVKPTRPETSFAYIQYDAEQDATDNIYKVRTFTDKPNLDLARTFLKSGDFVWNSGIIAWNGTTFMEALERNLPDLYDVFVEAKNYYGKEDEQEHITRLFMMCTNVSFDNGLLERVNNVYVIPSYFGWTDLGNWESVYDNVNKDYLGNAVLSKNVMIIDANDCIIKVPGNKLAVLQGLENMIVVDTEDVLLICERNHKHKIKDYIAEVKRTFGEKYL